jgi:DUF1009 family protein
MTDPAAPTLGIIAGGGEAPKRLIEACQRLAIPFHVLALEGITDSDIGGDDVPHSWLPLGAAAAARDLAKANNVRDIVMLGRVRRPSISELKPDALMLQKIARIGLNMLGDDGLLKAIAKEFEAEGFRVIAAQDVLKDFLMPSGVLGKHKPPAHSEADIKRGIEIAKALGALDVGQSVVVQQGIVLGVEAIEGTDALIRRCATLRREGPSGVLVKLKKPQQDARFDLPCIGAQTVKEALSAGLAGIAVEAGGALLLDKEEAVRVADASRLFLMGITP